MGTEKYYNSRFPAPVLICDFLLKYSLAAINCCLISPFYYTAKRHRRFVVINCRYLTLFGISKPQCHVIEQLHLLVYCALSVHK